MRKQFTYARLFALQHGRCFYCQTHLSNHVWENKNKRRLGWTRDHFLPKCLGYGLTRNVVLTCRTCNARKGDSIPDPKMFVKMILIYAHFTDGALSEIVGFMEMQSVIDRIRL